MPRILAIDFGRKRTGLAWTDPYQIIASGLPTIATHTLELELKKMLESEAIEKIVLGYPTQLNGENTDTTKEVLRLRKKLEAWFPEIPVILLDERFTSSMAKQAILDSGVSKKKRQDKGLIDQVSATIILQSYMSSIF
jgi:putative holliday junction resolvase